MLYILYMAYKYPMDSAGFSGKEVRIAVHFSVRLGTYQGGDPVP